MRAVGTAIAMANTEVSSFTILAIRSIRMSHCSRKAPLGAALSLLATSALSFYASGAAAQEVSSAFGPGGAVPSGTVRHSKEDGKHVLTLSADFSIHVEPPDPHWRVIDSTGNVFLLDKLKVADDKLNSSIVLPTYIANVAKVQMWCAFVESVLGEVVFEKPVALK